VNSGLRRALLLSLIGARDEELSGIVRLQKMLFLLEKEAKVRELLRAGYDFEAYRFGPYSREVYDDLEFLENLGLIRTRPSESESEVAEESEEDILLTDYSLSRAETSEFGRHSERTFALTREGSAKLKEIIGKLAARGVDAEALQRKTRQIREKYDRVPLYRLIRYVYKKYPDFARNSELVHLK